jgi:hypothetical protein
MFEKLIAQTKLYFLLSGIITIAILLLTIIIYLLAGLQGLYITLFMIILVFGFFLWMYVGLNSKRRESTLEELERKKAYIRRLGEIDAEETVYGNIQRRNQQQRNMHPNNMGFNRLKNIFK